MSGGDTSPFAFDPNPPPDYRMVGRVFGVLGALASTGYTFVIATSVGGHPFARIGMSQGGVLVLYWVGWLSLGWIIGWAAPRIAGRMGSATVGALISSGAFISVMLLSPAPAWPTYIIPFGVFGMAVGALMWKSNG